MLNKIWTSFFLVALAAALVQALALGNHGVFAWGKSPKDALKAAIMVEDVAKTVHLAMALGKPEPIPPEEAEKWYQRYHTTYGQK